MGCGLLLPLGSALGSWPSVTTRIQQPEAGGDPLQRATGERRRRTVRHPVSVTPCTTFFITTSKSCVCGNSLSCSDLSVYSEGAHKMFIYSRNVGQGPTAVTLQCPRPQTRAPAWHPVLRGRSEQPRSPSSLSGTPPAPFPREEGEMETHHQQVAPGAERVCGCRCQAEPLYGKPSGPFPRPGRGRTAAATWESRRRRLREARGEGHVPWVCVGPRGPQNGGAWCACRGPEALPCPQRCGFPLSPG